MYKDLIKISTYARSIGKSCECIRIWIRSGKWKEGKDYVSIDGVIFIKKDRDEEVGH